MTGIKIGDQWLDLGDDFEISFDLSNPLFNDNPDGEYSLPVTIPSTDENLILLNNPDLIENSAEIETLLTCALIIDDEQWQEAQLQVSEIDREERTIEIVLYVGRSAFFQSLPETKISDLDLGSYELVQTHEPTVTIRMGSYAYSDGILYRVILYGVNYDFFDTGPVTGVTAVLDIRDQINADYPGMAAEEAGDDGDNYLTLTFDAGEDFWSDFDFGATPGTGTGYMTYVDSFSPAEAQLADWADHMDAVAAADFDDFDYAWPMIYNPGFYDGDTNTEWEFWINFWKADTQQYSISNSVEHDEPLWEKTIVPNVYLRVVWNKLLELYGGYELISAFLTEEDIQRLIIYSVRNMDHWVDNPYEDGGNNEYNDSFDFANYVPEINVEDFFKAVEKLFNGIWLPDDEKKQMDFKRWEEIIESTVAEDITEDAEPLKKISFPSENGIKLTMLKDDNDGVYQENGSELVDLVIGNGFNEVDIPVGTVHTRETEEGARTLLLPYAQQRSADRCAFRVLFYRGMQEDSNGDEYPMATCYASDFAHNAIGVYSLMPFLVYSQWYNDWLDKFNSNRAVPWTLRWDVKKLKLHQWVKKYRIAYQVYLLKRMTVVINKNGIDHVEAEAMKV